jgi:sodium transport system permease protein
MRARVIKSLYKKEMLDVLRDKKTVLMMIVVPIILYPLLFLGGILAMNGISSSMNEKKYRVAFSDGVNPELVEYFENADSEDYSFEIVKNEDLSEYYGTNNEDDESAEQAILDRALQDEKIDVYIMNESESESYGIYYLSSVTNSSYGADEAGDAIDDYSEAKSREILSDAGMDADYVLEPVKFAFEDKSSSEESAGSLMGSVIPFMLVVSLLMGTMYPAIDTTAGERERGTLETMLTLPITNQELIFGKFLTVATIGVISSVLNLISMGGICIYMYNMIYKVSDNAVSVNLVKFIPAIIVGVLCIFAFAIFISAITMCVCAFARTYKEANNYITPLMLVVMFASFIGLVPNVELNAKLALVPVANICLLIKNMLAFKYSLTTILIVLVSNVAYGIISVLLLGRIYKSEGILFGDSLSGIRIFERRSNIKKNSDISIGDMLLVIAVTVLLVIYAGGAASLDSVTGGIILTQLSIIGVPVLSAWYTRCDMKKSFKLKLPKLRDIPAAVFLMAGTMLLGMIITMISSSVFKSSADSAVETTSTLMSGGFAVSLLLVALLPAVCEEFMFRGYILGALQARFKPAVAILATACIFGLYHMNIVRFFTTAFLGLVLAYVAYKTKSIIPGIIMHFLNNATACLQMYYPEKVAELVPVLARESFGAGEIVLIFAAGLVLFVLGLVMLE